MAILKFFNIECTSAYPKDHSCEVSLQSELKINFHGYHGNDGHFIVNSQLFRPSKYNHRRSSANLKPLCRTICICLSSYRIPRSLDIWFLTTSHVTGKTNNKRKRSENSKWVIDCCLTSTQQFFSYVNWLFCEKPHSRRS